MKITVGASDVGVAFDASIQVSGIENPAYVQTTDDFTLRTRTSGNVIIDSGSASGLDITTGDLVSPTVTSATYVAGDDSANYTIAFTTANPIPQNGDIQVTFDSDYDLSSAAYVSGNTNAPVPEASCLTPAVPGRFDPVQESGSKDHLHGRLQ